MSDILKKQFSTLIAQLENVSLDQLSELLGALNHYRYIVNDCVNSGDYTEAVIDAHKANTEKLIKEKISCIENATSSMRQFHIALENIAKGKKEVAMQDEYTPILFELINGAAIYSNKASIAAYLISNIMYQIGNTSEIHPMLLNKSFIKNYVKSDIKADKHPVNLFASSMFGIANILYIDINSLKNTENNLIQLKKEMDEVKEKESPKIIELHDLLNNAADFNTTINREIRQANISDDKRQELIAKKFDNNLKSLELFNDKYDELNNEITLPTAREMELVKQFQNDLEDKKTENIKAHIKIFEASQTVIHLKSACEDCIENLKASLIGPAWKGGYLANYTSCSGIGDQAGLIISVSDKEAMKQLLDNKLKQASDAKQKEDVSFETFFNTDAFFKDLSDEENERGQDFYKNASPFATSQIDSYRAASRLQKTLTSGEQSDIKVANFKSEYEAPKTRAALKNNPDPIVVRFLEKVGYYLLRAFTFPFFKLPSTKTQGQRLDYRIKTVGVAPQAHH